MADRNLAAEVRGQARRLLAQRLGKPEEALQLAPQAPAAEPDAQPAEEAPLDPEEEARLVAAAEALLRAAAGLPR